jgi:hypothetical protein
MTLYIDISLSRRHLGTPHGLARVEVGIAQHLSLLDPSCVPIWVSDNFQLEFGNSLEIQQLSDGQGSTKAAFGNFAIKPASIPNRNSYLTELMHPPGKQRLKVIGAYLVSVFPQRFA